MIEYRSSIKAILIHYTAVINSRKIFCFLTQKREIHSSGPWPPLIARALRDRKWRHNECRGIMGKAELGIARGLWDGSEETTYEDKNKMREKWKILNHFATGSTLVWVERVSCYTYHCYTDETCLQDYYKILKQMLMIINFVSWISLSSIFFGSKGLIYCNKDRCHRAR